MPPIACFITFELLRRLHNIINEYTIEQRGGWAKQPALAKLVVNVTGARRPRSFTGRKDWEHAGNAMDVFVRDFCVERNKVERACKAALGRAAKKGKELPSFAKLDAVLQRVFECDFGCTPRGVAIPDGVHATGPGGGHAHPPIRLQPVQWVSEGEQVSRLQQEIVELKQQPQEVPILERQLDAAIQCAGVSERARGKAEQQAKTARAEAAFATSEVERVLRERKEQQKKQQRAAVESKEQRVAAANQILALQGNVVASAAEAGALARKLEEAEAQLAEERQAWDEEERQLRELKARAHERARNAVAELDAAMAGAQASVPRRTVQTPQTKGAQGARARLVESDSEDDLQPEAHGAAWRAKAAHASKVAAEAEAKTGAEALKRQRAMPTWRAVREAGSGKGRAKIEWGTRVVIYSLLALAIAPSAIPLAIVAIVTRTAPWLKPTAPTVETIRRCRFELRFVEEASSARRVAAAYRVRGIGFDETTKLGEGALTSNVSIEPTQGAPLEDVILRAAYTPLGGTSEKVVESIDKRCFARLRDMLRRWEAKFHEMFPDEKWTGPVAARLGLHQLGGGGAIQSDTCTTARKAKRLLAELVATEVETHLGAAKWAAMSEEEQAAAVRTHPCDCWQHLRNIFLAEMSSAQVALACPLAPACVCCASNLASPCPIPHASPQAKHMKEELQAELDTFSAWERMSTDYSQVLRATYKEFHHCCRYYKGKGKPYDLWLRETYPKAFVLHLERADGGRQVSTHMSPRLLTYLPLRSISTVTIPTQDLDYDAALPLYVDRRYFVEYLHTVVFAPKHSNILEDFLYVTWRSLPFVAATRANALIDLLISRPLRWLTGKTRELTNWSPFSMGEALDLVEQFFMKAQHDGSLFLNPQLDIFAPIAAKQPLFAQWRENTFTKEHVLSPDESEPHLKYKLVRDELLQPKDPTNIRSRDKTIEYLEVQCVAALRKMHDKKLALADKLTSQDGVNSIGNQAQGHADTQGCHASNDALAESVFGTFDMILRRFPGQ